MFIFEGSNSSLDGINMSEAISLIVLNWIICSIWLY